MNENLIEARYNITKKPKLRRFYESNKILIFSSIFVLAIILISFGVYFENKEMLNKIMLEFDIDPLILVTIVGIETNYGKKYAEYSVFNSLYTQIVNLPKRSSWATKELFHLLLYTKDQNISPFQLEGSYAGAFGYGQFIPSSFNKLSIDYNKDGKKDPYDWEDVLGSIAYYLTQNGYPKNDYNFSFRSPIWRSIRTYNRSDKYANTIIDFRNELSKKVFLSY